jgi:hypothetical protein
MYPNALPWWLQWIDGSALVLVALLVWALYKARTSGGK